MEELKKQKAYFLNDAEADKVAKVLVTPDFRINAEMVGQSPQRIATAAGFSVPDDVRVLVARLAGVGKQFPLSAEKLSPVFALFIEDGWQKGCERCMELLNFGGRGHTLGIHMNDKDVVTQFALKNPAFRIVVNSPTAIGAVGYTTGLDPSMTLGCGSFGGNITSDNIGPRHLLNIKRVAWETKPLSMARETGAWRPTLPASTTRVAEFPYQKALASDVSRKGNAQPASVKSMPTPAEKFWLASREADEKKYGAGKMSGEQVDKIVSEFVKARQK